MRLHRAGAFSRWFRRCFRVTPGNHMAVRGRWNRLREKLRGSPARCPGPCGTTTGSRVLEEKVISVAPMMDWTDRHCRYLHRLLSRRALLYTEMVTTGALVHGDVPRHLRFNAEEHPVALQLGGSEPADLAHCAKLGEEWGYDEVNLNCGCPSERVQRGAFGACLMNEPQLVADCVKAMVDVVDIPVTVKHRIGIDKIESYEFVRDFVGTVSEAGCQTFIVHARNAWLQGLSPKQNREIPPLRYELVHRLKHEFPALKFAINGGISVNAQVHEHLRLLDGVMVGREAYHNPWWLAEWDAEFYGAAPQAHARRGRVADVRLHGPRSRRARHALVVDCAPHARPAQRPARRAPLAPGLERPQAEDAAGARGDGTGARACRPDGLTGPFSTGLPGGSPCFSAPQTYAEALACAPCTNTVKRCSEIPTSG
jgi:tRNA-dihydrouridine synthase A